MKRSTLRVLRTLACLSLLFAPFWRASALADSMHHAGLIVVYGPDEVFSTCVAFSEAELPGTEVLRRAGLRILEWALPGQGSAVCKIGNAGCDFPGEDCFCQCMGTPCRYWSYWYWQKGEWVYSGRGAGSRVVRDGDVDAWVWGDGNSRPPVISYGTLCAGAPTVLPTPAAVQATQAVYPATTASPEPARSTPTTDASAAATVQATSAPAAVTSAVPEPYPAATASPTLTPRALAQATQPAVQRATTATVAPSASSTGTVPAAAEDAGTGGLSPMTPTADAAVKLIGTSAAESRTTATVTPSRERPVRRSYGAFVLLAILLSGLIAYAALVRRQRQR